MPDTPSITINKRMTYRGAKEVWSNTYHFSGDTPATDTAWAALAKAIWDEEAKCLSSKVEYVGYLGYKAGDNHAVSIQDRVADGISLPTGTSSASTGTQAGDTAVWVRWRLPTRNSRGKWNYLRKYFHGVPTANDDVDPGARTALQTYAAKMKDGTLPGGFKICHEQGAPAGDIKVAPFVSYRQLKRTGKRPSR